MMDIDDASRNGVGEIVDAKIESTISTITATTALTEHTHVLRSMLQTTFRQILDVCNCNGDPDCEKQSKLANESFDWMTRYTKEGIGMFYQAGPNAPLYKWIEVKKSEIVGAGNGLFACQDIRMGEIITIYLGKVIDGSTESVYSITNGSIVLDCDGWKKGELHLGAHMVNDPNWKMEGDAQVKCVRAQNARIGDRFEFIATKNISIGEEILLCYNLVMSDLEQTSSLSTRSSATYSPRLSNASLHPLTGSYIMRLDHTSYRHWPSPCKKEDYCQFHRFFKSGSKPCRRYKHLVKCKDCNVTLCSGYCYRTFNEMWDTVAEKKSIQAFLAE